MSFTSNPSPSQPNPTPAAPTIFINQKPLNIKNAPTLPPTQGGGTDINSPVVQSSISEIEKLNAALPFERDFTTSAGVAVSIVIPRQTLQTNSWTLKAQIFGINYNTSPEQEDYEVMSRSFVEAANVVFSWIKQNNVDPERIIFVWGDRKYIQDQAEKWLNPN